MVPLVQPGQRLEGGLELVLPCAGLCWSCVAQSCPTEVEWDKRVKSGVSWEHGSGVPAMVA